MDEGLNSRRFHFFLLLGPNESIWNFDPTDSFSLWETTSGKRKPCSCRKTTETNLRQSSSRPLNDSSSSVVRAVVCHKPSPHRLCEQVTRGQGCRQHPRCTDSQEPRVCLCWAVKLDIINPVLGRANQLPAGAGLLLRPLQREPNGTFGGFCFWRGGALSAPSTVV